MSIMIITPGSLEVNLCDVALLTYYLEVCIIIPARAACCCCVVKAGLPGGKG